jgi:predicted GIY-YIG superfamily endonuclease
MLIQAHHIRRRKRPKADDPCSIYRFYNAWNTLLYVGIARDAVSRLLGHRGKSWYGEIAHVRLIHCKSRKEALELEAYAIKHEKPLYNIMGKSTDKKTTAPKSNFKFNPTPAAVLESNLHTYREIASAAKPPEPPIDIEFLLREDARLTSGTASTRSQAALERMSK